MARLSTTSSLTLLFLQLTIFYNALGQVETQRYWFLGNGTNGIRFDQPANNASLVTKPAVAYGTGGGAVATDATSGTLLFYTDGNNVYDMSNAVMPNGGGLLGNANANNPAVVCPVPGQPNQYYIITNDANYNTITGTIRVTTVDMAQFGNSSFPSPATGVVTTKNQPIPGLTGQAEGMIIIPHSNGTDYWLITQTSGTTDYTVTQIGPGGAFTSTTFSNVGVSISAATFAYNATTGQLAVAPQSPNADVPILGFDNTTGALTFNQYVLSSGVLSTTNQAIYDVEWSPDGQFLYLSVAGEAGIQADVLQYDLTNPTISLASVLPQPNSIFRSFGLQVAPDSSIYHLYQATSGGPILMGKITEPDTVAAETNYVTEAFPGTVDFNARQFPSFSPKADVNLNVSFTSQGTCSNAPTTFFPTVTPDADSLVWDFGDGTFSNEWSPTYTYQNGGAYPVTVTAYLNGDSAQATVPLNITQFDLQISLTQDTTACSCELPFPKAPNPPAPCSPQFTLTAQVNGGSPTSTQWFGPSGLLAGQTTTTLTPDSAGYYYIKVGDASGCFAYAGVNIKEYGVQDQRANVWYFGNNSGIDFNPLPDNPPVAISNPVMNAPEGTATISDRNGQVVIFTDGNTIWYRDFTVLATGIGGDPNSTQSSIIVPVPGDETLYYIFTTEAVDNGGFRLKYSLYDLKVGTTGAVIEQDVLLYEKSTERVASNGNWLVTHEWGNNNFRAYQVTSNGISNPVVSSAGSDHNFSPPENAEGYMKFGGNNLLAVAIPNPGVSNTVELFDFVDSSGVVTNPRIIDLNQAAGEVYGIEFSPGGNKLFATVRNGGSSIIYEYAIDSLGNTTLLQAQNIAGDLGAMQVGPDGQIYIAVDGSNSLLSFTANENLTQLSPLAGLQNFPLTGTSTLGLPNFIQNVSTPLQGPAISASGFCLGSPTDFTGSGTDVIDSFQWFFGDGQGSTDQQTQHTYAAAGTYNVSLRITNRCGLDTTLTQQITITAPPAPPTFLPPGQLAVLCTGSVTLEATPATNPDLPKLSFIWSTGETTRTITVNRQANYAVTIVDTLGCSSNGSLIVADNRPIVELGPDLTLCQNVALSPLDAQNSGANYQWEINTVPSGTAQTHSVDTSVPGLFEYKVEVTDPITTCSVRDSITYTINQSPVFTATGFNTTACGANDGHVELTITDPATSLFTYSIVGASPTVSAIDQPIGGPYSTPNDRMPGVYGVTVIDQVSGCFSINTASVNDNSFTVSGIVNGTCDPMKIDVSTNPAQVGLTYRVIDNATAAVVDNGGPINSPFTTNALPSNNRTYVVEVTSGGCTASGAPLLVNEGPTVPITSITADGCVDPVTLTVTGGTSWAWAGSNITSPSNMNTITATPPQGLQTYSVTVSQAGFCDLDTTITVNVDNNIVTDLIKSDPCSDLVTLTASPSGPYLYRWFRDGVLDPGLGGAQVTATTANNGEQYMVDIYNPASGCTHPSPVLTVDVIGALTLDLSSTFACEGSPFTITGTTNQPVSSYEWSYQGNIIPNETSATLNDTRGGIYSALVSLSGCETEEEIQVLLAPLTPGKLITRAFICNDPANTDPNTNQVVLDPGAGFASYNWSKDGVPLGNTDPTFTATEPGIYSVELENSFGCISNDETEVNIECLPKITGPNAFRPGGQSNPEFFLFTFFIDDEDFQIFIFNRWGEMVFQSDNREFKWNGSYNNAGKLLPPGTYSYIVKYKSSYRPEDGIKEKRGGVVLLR